MVPSRASSAITQILLLALFFPCANSSAARGKQFEELTDCRYVEQPYNDGDSFHLLCGNREFVLRLYFVDTPEADLRYPERTREQAAHFGITLDAVLHTGEQAAEATRQLLKTPFIVRTRWAHAQSRAETPRYYGFVEVGGQNLAEILVSRGLARIKGVTSASPTGEPSRVFLEKLRALERDAREQRRGAWETSTGDTSPASR